MIFVFESCFLVLPIVSMQGSKHIRRTYGEARDFVYYLPAALDGKLSVVKEELRADLAAVVQLLIILVCLSSGKKPATAAELKKAWGECTVSLYKHVDALSRHITPYMKEKKKKRKASGRVRHDRSFSSPVLCCVYHLSFMVIV